MWQDLPPLPQETSHDKHSRLETVNSDGTASIHTSKASLTKALSTVYTKRYQLTQKAPFMVNPMLRFTGYTGLTPHTTQILQGTFPNPAPHDQDLQYFLNKTQTHPALPTTAAYLPNSITPKDFRMTFATNKETKASPPSRRHYGIYKTMATDPYLCKVGSAMMSIPYMSGYSPQMENCNCPCRPKKTKL